MAIVLNGGSNPAAVFYNGTSLEAVWARSRSDDGAHWYEVWNAAHAFPATIDQVSFTSDTAGIYLRGLTLAHGYIGVDQSAGKLYKIAIYESDESSFNFRWDRYMYVGDIYDGGSIDVDWQEWYQPVSADIGDYDSITVKAAGNGETTAWGEGGMSANLDFKASTRSYADGDSRIASAPTIAVDGEITWTYGSSNSRGIMLFTNRNNPATSSLSTPRWLYTATTGVIVQRPVSVRLVKEL